MAFDPNDPVQMNELANKARQIQEDMQRELKALDNKEFLAIASMGSIKIRMMGNYKVKSVTVAPDYASTHTGEQLGNALTQAFNQCRDNIEAERTGIGEKYSRISNEEMLKAMSGGN